MLNFGFFERLLFALFNFGLSISSEHAGSCLEVIKGLSAMTEERWDIVVNDSIDGTELYVHDYMSDAFLDVFDEVVNLANEVQENIGQIFVFRFILGEWNHVIFINEVYLLKSSISIYNYFLFVSF